MTDATSIPQRFFKGQDDLKGPIPADLVAATYRAEIVGFPPMDAAAHADFGRAFYAGFPDLYHIIDEVIEGQPHVTTRFTLRGTHAAPFMGIPPTGRSVVVSAVVILTVEDGRVTRLRGIFDQLGLLRQIGVVAL